MIIGTKTRRVQPDITVVEISGHLNLGNNLMQLEHMLKGLIAEGMRKLAIDLAALNFIDSAGIGMLGSTDRWTARAGSCASGELTDRWRACLTRSTWSGSWRWTPMSPHRWNIYPRSKRRARILFASTR
jgi:anti-anti-sigma factor